VLLPSGDEAPGALVVHDRRARSSEGETTAGTLGTASNRPRPGRAAALAQRRCDADEGGEAGRAHGLPESSADSTPLRQHSGDETGREHLLS
jgi:hypothetical protein